MKRARRIGLCSSRSHEALIFGDGQRLLFWQSEPRDLGCYKLGFSLIEVMVAVSLLAVIIVGLLAMFYQTQRAFRSGIAQVDVLEGGRATLDLISRELQEMTAASDPTITNVNLFVRFPDLRSGQPGL